MAKDTEKLYKRAINLIAFRKGTKEQKQERDTIVYLLSLVNEDEKYNAELYARGLLLCV